MEKPNAFFTKRTVRKSEALGWLRAVNPNVAKNITVRPNEFNAQARTMFNNQWVMSLFEIKQAPSPGTTAEEMAS